MMTTMLGVAMLAHGPAAAGGVDVHVIAHPRPPIASLPMAAVVAWPPPRCGEGVPGAAEAVAEAAIDAACTRLVVRDRASERPVPRGRSGGWSAGAGGGGGGGTWRLAQALLPGLEGLQGLVGPGGLGLGVGSELKFARHAHMTLHLAAARDTRIADTAFAPETTVRARCGACWDESEAVGAGINGGRRASPAAGR